MAKKLIKKGDNLFALMEKKPCFRLAMQWLGTKGLLRGKV